MAVKQPGQRDEKFLVLMPFSCFSTQRDDKKVSKYNEKRNNTKMFAPQHVHET